MDVKTIIREMLKKGMTREQIKASLQELGMENAEELIESAANQIREAQVAAAPKQEKAQAPKKEEAAPSEPKELFEEMKPEPSQKEAEPEQEEKKEAEGEKPGFSFTTISGEGEKEETVGEKLGEEQPDVMTGMPKTSLSDMDSVERKLDETIALLKALQDINKKILDTERNVLLRLKT